MATKTVTITDVVVTSAISDSQRRNWGTPDVYLVFKTQQGAPLANRDDHLRNDTSPTFAGPFVVALGGPLNTELVGLEVWDHDAGTGSRDDLMEAASLAFEAEPASGRKSWSLSRGGEVALSWEISGRQTAKPPSPSLGQRTVKIKRLAAARLLPRDGARGTVDPYILISGKSQDVQERWDTVRNNSRPIWDQEVAMAYDPRGYSVEVWDDDLGFSPDDLCGTADLVLAQPEETLRVALAFGTRDGGELTVDYVLAGAGSNGDEGGPTPPVDPLAEPENVVVVRKEIRKMPAEEQQRFVAALKKTMENRSGPQTSEYFRIAGYHGWPSDYCHHGQETFPGWHRGYCVELEQALQAADRELGNDGNIGLPYWDWADQQVNGEVFPRIIRESFPGLPEGFLNESDAGDLGREGFSGFREDAALLQRMDASRVIDQARQCLTVAEHWMHASTRFNRQGFSVESPHNSMHVNCGFPMTTVRYAAFHPAFFLHHCNVDRLYEKHVQIETPAECAEEFSNRQRQLSWRGEPNRYRQPLEPFNHPRTGSPLMPADTFDTKALGYVYDELPPTPTAEMRMAPVFAAFKNIKVLDLKRKSYTVHVFVVPSDASATWAAPAGGTDAWLQEASYAGCGGIFGGKGSECSNCVKRNELPLNLLVEVQTTLVKLGLSRHQAALRVMCEDERGAVTALEDTPLPQPVIVGPLFEDVDEMLGPGDSEWAAKDENAEVLQLQNVLEALGYEPGKVDGKFGPKTDAAVKRFQEFTGAKVDGIAGPKTKGLLLGTRNDWHPDFVPEQKQGKRFVQGRTVRYTVGPLPGYMKAQKTLTEIASAFAVWGKATGVNFQWSGSALRASLYVQFADLAPVGEKREGLARPGGQLAEATPHCVTLDAGERWLLEGGVYPGGVKLYPVLVHEIGHVFGLAHSSNPKDVMWPYYDEAAPKEPSPRDIELARMHVQSVAAVAKDEAAAVLAIFQKCDVAGTGLIKREGLVSVMKALFEEAWFTSDVLEAVMADVSINDDVDYKKFVAWVFGASGA